ncbi:MAG: GHMP kinase [Acidobacteria bacterium]|nr:GHMP kinase [Acidobacteriota bacterium]
MRITSQSPCRVDLAGGTLDIWPLYLHHNNAVTVNFAVNRYTSCSITPRNDGAIILRSRDLAAEESFASLEELRSAKKYKLPLLAYAVRFFAPETGLELDSHSEAPAGAGISGSSSLLITICGAFNKWLNTGYPIERVRELAQNIEAQILRVPTGCQDYYPAMYGGISAIELRADGIRRVAIPVEAPDLESRTVLAYTGVPRNSGINNWEVTKLHIDGDKKVHRNFDQIAAIAHAMRGALERSDWNETARLLREEWSFRKKNAPGITTELIDHLVAATRRAGSVGAKVCGAGGGGCVFFLVEPGAKTRVAELIAKEGATVLDVKVAPAGLKVKLVK